MVKLRLIAHAVFWFTLGVFIHDRYFLQWVVLGSRLHGMDAFVFGALFTYVVLGWEDFVRVGKAIKGTAHIS